MMMLTENISFFHPRDLIYKFFVYSKIMNTEKNFFINGLNYKYNLSDFHLSCLIEKFIEKKDVDPTNIAVALNETLIKKSEWKKTKVSENDRIEIVIPFAGG